MSSKLLDKTESLGKAAKGYKFGSIGPIWYDCSGLIYAALRALAWYSGARFVTGNIISNSQFVRLLPAEATVGDVIVWSASLAHGHMGVVSGPDEFYSARSVASGIKNGSISGFKAYPGTKPFYLRPVAVLTSQPRTLQVGDFVMTGPDIKRLQQALVKAGNKTLAVDGSFGPKTRLAVIAYQKAHKLEIDGEVGPKTRASLGL